MDMINRIALDLKLDKSYLARIASRSAFYYRDFKIKKACQPLNKRLSSYKRTYGTAKLWRQNDG